VFPLWENIGVTADSKSNRAYLDVTKMLEMVITLGLVCIHCELNKSEKPCHIFAFCSGSAIH
jgi:hypothetical protein